MSRDDPARGRKWRAKLHAGDERELLKWVRQSGLERVARIIATLADAAGEHGQPEKPDSLLLLKIAHLKLEQPRRALHNVADEVAGEAHQNRQPRIAEESLVSKLERDFRRQRHTWTMPAHVTPKPSARDISKDARRPQFAAEFRVLARLTELLPTAIDLYDSLLADTQTLGADKEKLVKRLGREQVEPLLAEALRRRIHRKGASPFVADSRGVEKIPRNFFDLIEADLVQLDKAREQAVARARVGRKPPQ